MPAIAIVVFLFMLAVGIAGTTKGIRQISNHQIRRGISYLSVGGFLLFALAVLFILPAVVRAPAPSRRSHCMSNLAQIGKALKMYSMDHADQFPPTLLGLTNYLNTSVNSPKIFVCPSSGHEPGSLSKVDDWTDYSYVSGLTEIDPCNCVHAFCQVEGHHGEGLNVLYIDGSVQWATTSNFIAMTSTPSLFFGTTNETALTELQKRTKIVRGTKQIGNKK